MKKIILVFLVFFNTLFANTCKADHVAGADLGYICLGGNQYRINLNVYIDCTASSTVALQQKINFTSPCGTLPALDIDLLNPGGTEISQLCASQINNSKCNGGTLPGMKVYRYSADISITPACDTWTIYWWSCCRNNAITNLQLSSSNSMYLEATLNSVTSACNTSASFTAQPIPYACVSQPVNYNFGVNDVDGDSLYYSLVSAMGAGPANHTYTAGYSATSPISGITLNAKTGELNFTPVALGNYVVVVMVEEYDSNGNLKGSIKRDIQFVVQSCPNNVPDPAVAYSGLTTATQTGLRTFQVCRSTPFSFKAIYTDQDAGDVLTLTSDLAVLFPGSTVTTSGSNPLIASIMWILPPGSANTNFTFNVVVDDFACPIRGKQSYLYTVNIVPPCPADTSRLIVPNVFTPGGANPVFLINNYGLKNYYLQIFNRWGDKVFETNDPNTHWNGNNVSDGTYYYVIKAEGVDKKEYDKKGFVQRIGVR